MRQAVSWFVMVTLIAAECAGGSALSWNKIRYGGGSVPAKVDPYDWNTTLTVAPDAITLVIGYKQTLNIPTSRVTALSYGKEAHRRVTEMVVLGLMVTPWALFGILHKSKDHFVGIQYTADDGKPASVLLEVHKDHYKAVLASLKAATGKPVEEKP